MEIKKGDRGVFLVVSGGGHMNLRSACTLAFAVVYIAFRVKFYNPLCKCNLAFSRLNGPSRDVNSILQFPVPTLATV